jgi:transposase-like protein
MARSKKYPEELMQRAVRIALESERPVAHVAHDLGIHPETLRKRVRRAEADSGRRNDLLSSEEREAGGGAPPPPTVVTPPSAQDQKCHEGAPRVRFSLRRRAGLTPVPEPALHSCRRGSAARRRYSPVSTKNVRTPYLRRGRQVGADDRVRPAAGARVRLWIVSEHGLLEQAHRIEAAVADSHRQLHRLAIHPLLRS